MSNLKICFIPPLAARLFIQGKIPNEQLFCSCRTKWKEIRTFFICKKALSPDELVDKMVTLDMIS